MLAGARPLAPVQGREDAHDGPDRREHVGHGHADRIGGSSGEPLVSMAPLSAWMIVSMARTPGLASAPNPLIEQ